MKKTILLAIIFTALNTLSWAQGELKIILDPKGTTILNNDTVYVWGNNIDVMNIDFDVINMGSVNDNNIYVRRDSLLLPTADTDNTFCWGGFCGSSRTNVSTASESILKGDTAQGLNNLQCHYSPYGHLGMAYIRYTVYKSTSPSDSSWVVVGYDATPAGVQNISGQSISFSVPYPNPASNSVSFTYSIASGVQTADMKIFNMIGECIQTVPLNTSKNKAAISVQSMPSGIYVCEIEASGCAPTYQKLVVSH